jgi:hypothetical protein
MYVALVELTILNTSWKNTVKQKDFSKSLNSQFLKHFRLCRTSLFSATIQDKNHQGSFTRKLNNFFTSEVLLLIVIRQKTIDVNPRW